MKDRRGRVPLLVICFLAVLVYLPTVKTYFLQDDWVFLSHVYRKPFLSIFNYRQETFYRPVGQQLFFWISSKLFDLNSVGFHLMGLVVHISNIVLLKKVIDGWGKFDNWKWLLLLIFAGNPLHFISLNWLTQIDLELAVTFSLATFLFYRRWIRDKKLVTGSVTLACFGLALLSHEVASVWPLLLLIWFGWRGELIPLLGISLIGTMGKYLVNPFPLHHQYALDLHLWGLAARVRWYLWRGLGLPEGVRAFSRNFLWLALLAPVVMVLAFRGRLFSGLLLFGVGLLPVLGFSSHPLPAYATVALAALVIQLGRVRVLGRGRLSRGRLMLLSSGLALAFFFSVRAMWPDHWTTQRGETARRVFRQFQADSDLLAGTAVHVVSGSVEVNREVYFATLKGRQLQVLSGNDELEVTFSSFHDYRQGERVVRLL